MGLTRGLSAPIGVPSLGIQITTVYTDTSTALPPYRLVDAELKSLVDAELVYLVYEP